MTYRNVLQDQAQSRRGITHFLYNNVYCPKSPLIMAQDETPVQKNVILNPLLITVLINQLLILSCLILAMHRNKLDLPYES